MSHFLCPNDSFLTGFFFCRPIIVDVCSPWLASISILYVNHLGSAVRYYYTTATTSTRPSYCAHTSFYLLTDKNQKTTCQKILLRFVPFSSNRFFPTPGVSSCLQGTPGETVTTTQREKQTGLGHSLTATRFSLATN